MSGNIINTINTAITTATNFTNATNTEISNTSIFCKHVCNAKRSNNIRGMCREYKIDGEQITLCDHCAKLTLTLRDKYSVRYRACESFNHSLIDGNREYYQHKNTLVFRARNCLDKWRCFTCLTSQ